MTPPALPLRDCGEVAAAEIAVDEDHILVLIDEHQVEGEPLFAE